MVPIKILMCSVKRPYSAIASGGVGLGGRDFRRLSSAFSVLIETAI